MRTIIAGAFLALMMYGWFKLVQAVVRMENEQDERDNNE